MIAGRRLRRELQRRADIADDRGCGQDDRRGCIGQHRRSSVRDWPDRWGRERDGDKPGLQRAQEADDIVEALRGQDQRAISGSAAKLELLQRGSPRADRAATTTGSAARPWNQGRSRCM